MMMQRLLSTNTTPFEHQDLGNMLQKACIHEKTKAHFQRISLRAASLRLIPTLASVEENPLGFRTSQKRKNGTLLDFVCKEKERHPDKVILVRVGEFFEAFGVDALLLVEHCGLNAMGSKARAGCPRSNIQQTLDGLTSSGLAVAVYEESGDGTVTKAGLKNRYLAQIVSPSTSTYFHNSTLTRPDIEFRESRPYLGLQLSSRGSTTSSTVNDTISGSRAEGSIHYTVYEVNVESKFIRVSERLTEDAAKCFIDTTIHGESFGVVTGFAGVGGTSCGDMNGSSVNFEGNENHQNYIENGSHRPTVYYAGPPGSNNTIPSRTRRLIGSKADVVRLSSAEEDSRLFLQDMLNKISKEMESPIMADLKSYRMVGVGGGGFKGVYDHDDDDDDDDASYYRMLRSIKPRPLYSPTAQQLGLLPSPQVPDLVRYLLPRNDAPSAARNFLRRWLLRPPPPNVADDLSKLLQCLSKIKKIGLPTLRLSLTTRKLVALCSSSSANAAMFRELHRILGAVTKVLTIKEYDCFLLPLVTLVSYECGVSTTSSRLKKQVLNASNVLESVVVLDDEHFDKWLLELQHQQQQKKKNKMASDSRLSKNVSFMMMSACLTKNEMEWRSAVHVNASEETRKSFHRVDQCRNELLLAIEEDYGMDATEKDGKYDTINNTVYLMKGNNKSGMLNDEEGKCVWIRPKDRHGKLMHNRWTTERVEKCFAEYVSACEEAQHCSRSVLHSLCETFVNDGHMSSSICSIVMNDILLTSSLHVREFTKRGWELPTLEPIYKPEATATAIPPPPTEEGGANRSTRVSLQSVFPYWLPFDDAVTNDVDLNGQWLVTGPNMSGKSTLLRSVTAAALLANCGLAAPLKASSSTSSLTSSFDFTSDTIPIPRLDGYYLRTNGSDCPAEGLSAFALEADDIRILMRDVTSRSLAAVDELGRGTAPKEGAAIVGAVLEELDRRGCPSLFATHLHDELSVLPLKLYNTTNKVLRVVEEAAEEKRVDKSDSGPVQYVYRVEDGVCTNSHSLATAAYHGVGDDLIARASELRRRGEERREKLVSQEDGGASSFDSDVSKVSSTNSSSSTSKMPSVTAAVPPPPPSSPVPFSMEDVIQMVEVLNEFQSDVVEINPEFDPPPIIADHFPCVYLLEVIEDGGNHGYYIGETEHLADRMKRHRQFFGKNIKFCIFPVEKGGRTRARKTEARAIIEARRAGFMLHNLAS
jgi:DNA mismatch repair ATPase MutS